MALGSHHRGGCILGTGVIPATGSDREPRPPLPFPSLWSQCQGLRQLLGSGGLRGSNPHLHPPQGAGDRLGRAQHGQVPTDS